MACESPTAKSTFLLHRDVSRWCRGLITLAVIATPLAACHADETQTSVQQAVESAFYHVSGCRPFKIKNVKVSNVERTDADHFKAKVDLDLVASMSKADTDKVCNDPDRDVPMMHDLSMGDRIILGAQMSEFEDALAAGKPMQNVGDTVPVHQADLHFFHNEDGWRLEGDHS